MDEAESRRGIESSEAGGVHGLIELDDEKSAF
jgi:hypothetical protein